jgi:hypothetical protein
MENGAWRTEYGKWRMMNYIEDHKFQENHKLNSPLKREPVPIYREAGGVSAVFRRSPRYIPTRYQYSSLQKCGEACRNTRCPENLAVQSTIKYPYPPAPFPFTKGKGSRAAVQCWKCAYGASGDFPPFAKGGTQGGYLAVQSPITGVSIQFFSAEYQETQ